MTESVLLTDDRGDVVELTLNRPDKRNALSRALRRALVEAFVRLSERNPAPIVILTGAGKAFCAGLDLKELSETGISPQAAGADAGDPPDVDVVGTMDRYSAPIIGAINGVAVTGGFEVALACDLLIASPEARFADTHARVGILPGWGLSQKLPRLIGIGRAKELSFTGNYIGADQAVSWGLVNRVVAAERLLPVCRELAGDMLSSEPDVMRAYKRLIDAGAALPFGEAMTMERRVSREHARGVSADSIAARRIAVQQRGRSQND
jgi:enoyl-CoA hydratase